MSGQMFEVGSVIKFYPGKEPVRLVRMDGETFHLESQGWVLIAVGRDGWVNQTEMDVLIECCSSWLPGVFHFNDRHQGKENPMGWRLELGSDPVSSDKRENI